MTRSIHTAAAAVFVAAIGLASSSALASPTATLTLTASQYGTNTSTVKGGGVVTITAGYEVTNLAAGQSVHIEIDLCAPAAGVNFPSGGTGVVLPGCLDGYGENNPIRVVSPTLSAAGSSTGITGNYVITTGTVPGLTTNGEAWAVPGRIVLDNSAGAPLAAVNLALTISDVTRMGIYKTLVGVHDNMDTTTNVTWQVAFTNPINLDGTEPAIGTSTITDPFTAGATLVSATQVAPTTLVSVVPLWATIMPNSNAQITSDGSGVTISLDNVISGQGDLPSTAFNLVYQYPTTTAEHLVTNTANATFPAGAPASESASAYIGPDTNGVAGSISKGHLCPDNTGVVESRTANLPNKLDNLDCAWGPEYPVAYEIDLGTVFADNGNATNVTGLDVIDTLDPNTELASFDYFDFHWSGYTSTSATCTAGSTWVAAIAGQNFAPGNGIHCVRFTQGASPLSFAFMDYSARLISSEASTLEGELGAYIFVTNNATMSGNLVSVNGIAGTSGSASVTSTYWNMGAPSDSITSEYQQGLFGGTYAYVGAAFDLTGQLPIAADAPINDVLGYHDLSFSGTLPLELDLTGSPIELTAADGLGNPAPFVDGNGNATQLSCTWSPQSLVTHPITPASYRCEVVDMGGNPTFTPAITPGQDPFSGCSGPYYCQDGLFDFQNFEHSPLFWNELYISIPVKVVSGIAGTFFSVQLNAWSNEGETYASGLAYPGTSEANPAIAYTEIGIAGVPQLQVVTTATATSVVVGSDATFTIDYQNTGNVTTAGTYVYDIFGYDATTGQPLTGYQTLDCTSAPPHFDGVTHLSGTPPSVVEYTTDDPSTVAVANLTWSTAPPSDLSTVTGVRFLLNSRYTQNPGDYSPNDQPGKEQLSFQAPNTPGERLCSMAAVKANGLNLAGSIDLSSAVQILAQACQTDCNPNAQSGPPQTVSADGTCGVSVTVDATGSTQATHFAWYENNALVGSSDFPSYTTTVQLDGLGQHTLTLIATDADGIASSANTIVTVVDQLAPVVTCPASPGAVTLDSSCNASAPAITATAVDGCDGPVAATCDIYQPGQTQLTCSATDSSGNTGTCSVSLTVTGGPTAASLTEGDAVMDPTEPRGPNGGFCDDADQAYFFFTWNPGCTTVTGVTGSVSYTDSSGTHQLYVNQTEISGQDGTGAYYGFINFSGPHDAQGNPIDFLGPVTFTLSGPNGGSTSVQFQSGFETCTCVQTQDNGQQMILFEDLWPSDGDFDFNDSAIVHDFSYQTDVNNNITALRAQLNVVALGADIASGIYLHLPGLTVADTSSIKLYVGNGAGQTISGRTDESELVITIADDARSLFGGQSGFINTSFGPVDPNAGAQTATATATPVTVIINFATPLHEYDFGDGSKFLDTGAAPYDLFIAYTGNYHHQIHQPQYAGTSTMDTALFGQGQDISNTPAADGLFFIDQNFVPFALNIPQVSLWPQEKVDIGSLYPELIPYSQQGGANGSDYNNFYWYGDSSVTPAYGVQLADPTGASLPNAGPQFVAGGFCQSED